MDAQFYLLLNYMPPIYGMLWIYIASTIPSFFDANLDLETENGILNFIIKIRIYISKKLDLIMSR